VRRIALSGLNRRRNISLLLPSKEEVNAFARVRLSVCLSVSKITQKRVHEFGWNVACRQISGHGRTDKVLSPIRIIVRMPEPDCFLRYRMRCNAEFYYVGKIPRRPTGIGRPSLQRRVVLNGFVHREPWEQVCWWYTRSTECSSSSYVRLSVRLSQSGTVSNGWH